MLNLLSRMTIYRATHGITEPYKDYLSIIRDQGNSSYCWAYSLTSAIEMKHALNTGNRLMLDPFTLVNNTAAWWKKHDKKNNYEVCHDYVDGGYIPVCVLSYMYSSSKKMLRIDGNNSHLVISNFGFVDDILTVRSLISALDKYKLLYVSMLLTEEMLKYKTIEEYHETNETGHAVVLTSIGTIRGSNGIYAEILDSYGYDSHSDSLLYIKIADNESSPLHNNLGIFTEPYWIDVAEVDESLIYLTLFIVFAALFGLVIIFLIVMSVISHLRNRAVNKTMTDDNSSNNDIRQPLEQSEESHLAV